jgi:hypothetical protein
MPSPEIPSTKKWWRLACLFASSAASSSIDDFASFPARDLLTSSGGQWVAWTETVRGVTNVWATDLVGEPRAITNFTKDNDLGVSDGQDITNLRVLENQRTVLFTAGAISGANVNSLVNGTPPTWTWAASFDGSQARKVHGAAMVAVSESTGAVLYTTSSGTGSALWERSIQGDEPSKQLFVVQKGTIEAVVWHSDGGDTDMLAFTNTRATYSFVGLFRRGARKLVWVHPGVDSDVCPTWSPRGDRIAWFRARASATGYSAFDGDQGNRGPSFSVMTSGVSVSAGGVLEVQAAQEVFRDDDYGLPNFGYGRRPLAFYGDSTVLFGTEALSGWLHLVRVDLDAAPVAKVTELRGGLCEDREWLITEEYAWVSNNCDEIDSRGIERIRLSDGERMTVVKGTVSTVAGMSDRGWDAPAGGPGGMAVTGTHAVWLQSSWDAPLALHALSLAQIDEGMSQSTVITSDGLWARTVGPKLVRPSIVIFPSTDGRFQIHAQLFSPPVPSGVGVVYTHGGSERQVRNTTT